MEQQFAVKGLRRAAGEVSISADLAQPFNK